MNNMVKHLQETINNKMSVTDIVDVFAESCQSMDEDDMILFETGTYSFTGEKLFYFSLVKQVPNDDEYCQIHVDVLYKPDSENKKFNAAIWNEDLSEDIFDYIRNSKAFDYAKNAEYIGIDIYMDET